MHNSVHNRGQRRKQVPTLHFQYNYELSKWTWWLSDYCVDTTGFFRNFGVEKYGCITEEKVSSYRDDGICVFLLLGIPLSMEGRQKSKQGKQRLWKSSWTVSARHKRSGDLCSRAVGWGESVYVVSLTLMHQSLGWASNQSWYTQGLRGRDSQKAFS